MAAPGKALALVTRQTALYPEIVGVPTQANTIAALPADILLLLFDRLKSNPQDVVAFAKSCRRTYSLLTRVLRDRPLELFLNAVILHNRFDRVLPPLETGSRSQQLVLSLSCQDKESEQTAKSVLENVPRLHTLRLHVGATSEAKAAVSSIAAAISEKATRLRNLILSGTFPLQRLEQIVSTSTSLTTLDIRACTLSSEELPDSRALILASSQHTPELQSASISDLFLTSQQFSLGDVDLFKRLFVNCRNLRTVHVSCFVSTQNGVVERTVGTLERDEDIATTLRILQVIEYRMSSNENRKQRIRFDFDVAKVGMQFVKFDDPLPRQRLSRQILDTLGRDSTFRILPQNPDAFRGAFSNIQIQRQNPILAAWNVFKAVISRLFPFSR